MTERPVQPAAAPASVGDGEALAPSTTAVSMVTSVINETETPSSGLVQKYRVTHQEKMQARFATWLLGLSTGLYVAITAAAIFNVITVDDAQKLAGIIAAPQALTGAAVGFYYAGRRNG